MVLFAIDPYDDRALRPLAQLVEASLLISDVRDNPLRGIGWSGRANIGNEVEQRGVLLMTDSADDWRPRGGDAAAATRR